MLWLNLRVRSPRSHVLTFQYIAQNRTPAFLVNKLLIHELLHCCVMFSYESMLQQSVPEPRCMYSQFLDQYIRVPLSGRMDRYHLQHACAKYNLRLYFICWCLSVYAYLPFARNRHINLLYKLYSSMHYIYVALHYIYIPNNWIFTTIQLTIT